MARPNCGEQKRKLFTTNTEICLMNMNYETVGVEQVKSIRFDHPIKNSRQKERERSSRLSFDHSPRFCLVFFFASRVERYNKKSFRSVGSSRRKLRPHVRVFYFVLYLMSVCVQRESSTDRGATSASLQFGWLKENELNVGLYFGQEIAVYF